MWCLAYSSGGLSSKDHSKTCASNAITSEKRWCNSMIEPFFVFGMNQLTCPDKFRMWYLNSDIPSPRNQILVMVDTSDNETFSVDPRWNIRRIKRSQRDCIWRQMLNRSNESRVRQTYKKTYSRIWIQYIPFTIIIIHDNSSRHTPHRSELLGNIFN